MEKLLEHYYLNVLHKVFTLTRYINYSFFFFPWHQLLFNEERNGNIFFH